MAKKRRRSLFQSPLQRTEMWRRKMNPRIYVEYFNSVKDMALERMASYQTVYQYVMDTARSILESRGVETHLLQEYMWYALSLWRLTQRYKREALRLEAEAIYLRYLYRGRDKVALRIIAETLGIKLRDDYIILEKLEEVVGALRLSSQTGRYEQVSIPKIFIDMKGSGHLREFMIKSSRNDYIVKIIVDGVELYNNDYSWFQDIGVEVREISAFSENGVYVLHLSDMSFAKSLIVEVVPKTESFVLEKVFYKLDVYKKPS